MNPLWIGAAAILGAIIAAWLGWLESKEAFSFRKFGASMLRGVLVGAGFAATFNYATPASPWALNLVIAFIGGAGVDVLGHRIAGAVSK